MIFDLREGLLQIYQVGTKITPPLAKLGHGWGKLLTFWLNPHAYKLGETMA